MEIAELLIKAIDSAEQSFEDGELAYLALTSKVERPLMDRISYQLQVVLASQNLIVAREHSIVPGVRADLAVLKEGVPIVAVEAKAMYTADCARPAGKNKMYPDMLDADLKRYATLDIANLSVYSLLFGAHLLAPPPPGLGPVVKYAPLINQAFKPNRTAEQIRQVAEENLGTMLRAERRRASGKLRAGQAFGAEMEVLWWLYGAFSGQDGWAILRTGAA